MKNLAIITARGGSKRIPRKNIKEFLGKPIIVYSIHAALNSGVFTEVMVSTDDEEIAKVAIEYGAKVPFLRTAQNSNDHATTNDVILEVMNAYQSQNQLFDYACCFYPTAPFVDEKLIKQAYEILVQQNFDVVLPIVPFGFPIQRSFLRSESGLIKYAQPEHTNTRSQDLEKHYHDTGQFYFFNAKNYLERKSIICEKMYGLEVDEMKVQDIDNQVDWDLAELKYKIMEMSKSQNK